jgi:hypothetical protein
LTPEQGEWIVKVAVVVPGMTIAGYAVGVAKTLVQRAVIRRASAHLKPAVAESAGRVVDNDPRAFHRPGRTLRR